MAVPFYLPEGGADDVTSAAGGSSSDGASTSSSQSPNTTTSATQTPMQSPLIPGEQLVMAFCEAIYRCSSVSNGTPVFQYPTPPSPSCSVHSPAMYTGGEIFFPRARSTPRTPRTSVSFAAGEEGTFFRHHSGTQTTIPPPQSAPPMPTHAGSYHYPAYPYYQYTPPPTPTTSTGVGTFNMSTPVTTRLHRSHSDAARRSRLTSTGEDEREYHSEHETSWDDDERFDNFTAGRERLQEFNGRIPPRKKKKDVPKPKPEKKEPSLSWPAVVTVIAVVMGCGFLVAR